MKSQIAKDSDTKRDCVNEKSCRALTSHVCASDPCHKRQLWVKLDWTRRRVALENRRVTALRMLECTKSSMIVLCMIQINGLS